VLLPVSDLVLVVLVQLAVVDLYLHQFGVSLTEPRCPYHSVYRRKANRTEAAATG
jgi:hypothetical protein